MHSTQCIPSITTDCLDSALIRKTKSKSELILTFDIRQSSINLSTFKTCHSCSWQSIKWKFQVTHCRIDFAERTFHWRESNNPLGFLEEIWVPFILRLRTYNTKVKVWLMFLSSEFVIVFSMNCWLFRVRRTCYNEVLWTHSTELVGSTQDSKQRSVSLGQY